MFKLLCATQNYDWGKIGAASEVYKLLKNSVPNETQLNPQLPYAELWMGTHPSGPSYIAGTQDTSLAEYVSKNIDCLGSTCRERFGRTLPFLFKVLSVNKPLSIQAHPSKGHAKELHEQRPDLYKDANHKPEMAIALTPFEALVAFRPPNEIAAFVQGIPELHEIVGPECLSDLLAVSLEPEDIAGLAIKAAYQKLMQTDENTVSYQVKALACRLTENRQLPVIVPPDSQIDLDTLACWFIRLASDFPGDVGCFSLFFLNYVILEPGEAIFLEANLPHAYLSGDCVECMACSDNVVRAGLTPKFKDVECLLGMLLYDPRTVADVKFTGKQRIIDHAAMEWNAPLHKEEELPGEEADGLPEIISFKPPVEDFALDIIKVPANCKAFELLPVSSASIVLFVQGKGFLQHILEPRFQRVDNVANNSTDQPSSWRTNDQQPAGRMHPTINFTRGSVIFIGAGMACFVQPCADSHDCLAFRAYVNVDT